LYIFGISKDDRMIDVGRQISFDFLPHFRKCTVLQTLYANAQKPQKLKGTVQ
jgi:hypothetical protein